ncbi:hypothetical protein PRIPAC_80983 [Pristionchus pacificus]|uniref:BTB domain-containing protein n=1 Tax=Pristionchus pacificus TaxID=54126 RepID=A0A2A6BX19_PRIPA|nr:hypothetical protein PRIPAC_80983 [Pristionchus pacificus]|eukprot:PDM70439.1 BTB domain-containing protein [Pristionchus pacificus]
MSDDRKGVIRWELGNLNTIVNGVFTFSPPVTIAGLTWKISVTTECSPRMFNIRHLVLYLHCINDKAKTHRFWRADHYSLLKMIHRTDESRTRCQKLSENCKSSKPSQVLKPFTIDLMNWGFSIYKWSALLDQETGFIENGKLLFEAHINVSDTPGVSVEERIVKDFSTENETTDVCLIVEDKKIFVSKWALTMQSPVFKAMFHQHFAEKNKPEIEMQDVKHEDFVNFLNILCGSVRDVRDETVEGVLDVADRFQANSVLETIEEYLMHNSKFCIAKRLILSDLFRMEILQGHCLWLLKTTNDVHNLQMDDLFGDFSINLKARVLDRSLAVHQ